MREPFYVRLKKDVDSNQEIGIVISMFKDEKSFSFASMYGSNYLTCQELIDNNISWCNHFRNFCTTFQEMMYKIGYGNGVKDNIEENIPLLELLVNCTEVLKEHYEETLYKPEDIFKVCCDNINKLIDQMHLVPLVDKDTGVIRLVDVAPIEYIAAEKLEDDESFQILLKYRHHSLKHNLTEKRGILCTLWREIEGYRLILQGSAFKTIIEDAACLINNYDVRHCNTDGKNINPVLADMNDSDLEKVYDTVYSLLIQCIICASYVQKDSPYVKQLRECQKAMTLN